MRTTAARIVASLTAGSVLACQGGKPSAGAAVAPSASSSACSVSMGGPPGAIADPIGPYHYSVAIARTVDGVRLTGARVVLDHASVPDGVARSAGDALVYYVNGAMGYPWVGQTSDGTALSPLGPITLNGVSNPAGVVDPDAFRLPGGRIRLAYRSGFTAPSNSVPRAICLADSTDGMNFTVVGSAYDIPAGASVRRGSPGGRRARGRSRCRSWRSPPRRCSA